MKLLIIIYLIAIAISFIIVEWFFIWLYLKDGGKWSYLLKRKEIQFKVFINNFKANYYKLTENDYDIYYDDTIGTL